MAKARCIVEFSDGLHGMRWREGRLQEAHGSHLRSC